MQVPFSSFLSLMPQIAVGKLLGIVIGIDELIMAVSL